MTSLLTALGLAHFSCLNMCEQHRTPLSEHWAWTHRSTLFLGKKIPIWLCFRGTPFHRQLMSAFLYFSCCCSNGNSLTKQINICARCIFSKWINDPLAVAGRFNYHVICVTTWAQRKATYEDQVSCTLIQLFCSSGYGKNHQKSPEHSNTCQRWATEESLHSSGSASSCAQLDWLKSWCWCCWKILLTMLTPR